MIGVGRRNIVGAEMAVKQGMIRNSRSASDYAFSFT
jgi:hypothetical protein